MNYSPTTLSTGQIKVSIAQEHMKQVEFLSPKEVILIASGRRDRGLSTDLCLWLYIKAMLASRLPQSPFTCTCYTFQSLHQPPGPSPLSQPPGSSRVEAPFIMGKLPQGYSCYSLLLFSSLPLLPQPWPHPVCFFFSLFWTLPDASGYCSSLIHNTKLLPNPRVVVSLLHPLHIAIALDELEGTTDC